MSDQTGTGAGAGTDAGTTREPGGSTPSVTAPPTSEQSRVEAAAAATGAATAGTVGGLAMGTLVRHAGLVVVLVVLAIVGMITSPETFGTQSNINTILTNASVIGVVTVGMTFVIIGGGIDLSVGAIMALASVWCTTLATQSYGPGVMIMCALLVGTGTGIVNGLLIAYGRIVPFIMTLAMMASARGLAEQLSSKQTQVSRVEFVNDIARSDVVGVPVLVIILAVVVAAGWLLLERTTFGRRTVAIGGNPEASRLAGIDVRRHTVLLYALSGFCCGIAAIMIVSQTTAGSSTHGNLYELDAIAAAIIGGTLLTGGRGTIIGSLLGVLVFTVITNLFIHNNLPTEIQNIAKGAIIVGAALTQVVRRGSWSPDRPGVRPSSVLPTHRRWS